MPRGTNPGFRTLLFFSLRADRAQERRGDAACPALPRSETWPLGLAAEKVEPGAGPKDTQDYPGRAPGPLVTEVGHEQNALSGDASV
jgi:hypothetical protein